MQADSTTTPFRATSDESSSTAISDSDDTTRTIISHDTSATDKSDESDNQSSNESCEKFENLVDYSDGLPTVDGKNMADIVKHQFIVIIGDSNHRQIYKDFVKLLVDPQSRLLTTGESRSRGAERFLEMDLNEGQIEKKMYGSHRLHRGVNWHEGRFFSCETGFVVIRYYFVTRVFNEHVCDILYSLSLHDFHPNVIIAGSSLWDLSRYGTTDACLIYKNRLGEFFKFIRMHMPNTTVIWNLALPVGFQVEGGVPLSTHPKRNSLLWDFVEANEYAKEVCAQYDVEYVPLDEYFCFKTKLRLLDGIHWIAKAIRMMTTVLARRLSLLWNCPMLFHVKNCEKYLEIRYSNHPEGPNKGAVKRKFNEDAEDQKKMESMVLSFFAESEAKYGEWMVLEIVTQEGLPMLRVKRTNKVKTKTGKLANLIVDGDGRSMDEAAKDYYRKMFELLMKNGHHFDAWIVTDSSGIPENASKRNRTQPNRQCPPNQMEDGAGSSGSKDLPGQFTGSTPLKQLSQEEFHRGSAGAAPNKNMFKNAAPVKGGMGMHRLQKMGWKPGEGLGKSSTGKVQPLSLDIKTDRKGLVAQEEQRDHVMKERYQTTLAQQQAAAATARAANTPGPSGMSVPGLQLRRRVPGAGLGMFGGGMPSQHVLRDISGKHPVSALMELCAKKRWDAPNFNMINNAQAPAQNQQFMFKVTVNDVGYQPSTTAPNKKTARLQAAQAALQALGLL